MPNPSDLHPARRKEIEDILSHLRINNGNQTATARDLGVHRKSVYRAIEQAKKHGMYTEGQLEELRNKEVDAEESDKANNSLRRQLSDARREIRRMNKVMHELDRFEKSVEALHQHPINTTPWSLRDDTLQPPRGKHTPLLFWSDWHYDEVVRKEALNGLNEFNRDIADARVDRLVNTSIQILKSVWNLDYDGIVVALGGDMISGDIHDELRETNEATVVESTIHVAGMITKSLKTLADHFGKVYVPCVVGNHGRNRKKPSYKDKATQSYEFVLYDRIKLALENDDRITVELSLSADKPFSVHNTGFVLTHGDQFKGGSGWAGIFTPVKKGTKNKGEVYDHWYETDMVLMGHFHQYVFGGDFLVNGSLKGSDEFALYNGFKLERPQQAMMIVHEKNGIIYHAPIFCDED